MQRSIKNAVFRRGASLQPKAATEELKLKEATYGVSIDQLTKALETAETIDDFDAELLSNAQLRLKELKKQEEWVNMTTYANKAEKLISDENIPKPPKVNLETYHDIAKIGCAYRNCLSSIMQNPNIDEDKQKTLILHVRSILYCCIINIVFDKEKGKQFFDKAKNFFSNSKTIKNLKEMNFNNYGEVFWGENNFGTWANEGGWQGAAAALASGNAFYPYLLDGDKFVDNNGLLIAQDSTESNDDQTAADQATTDQTATDQAAADQTATDQAATDQTATDQAAADQTAADQTAADQTATDQTATDQTAAASGGGVKGGRSRRNKKRKTTKKKRIKRRKTTKKKRVKRRKYSLKR